MLLFLEKQKHWAAKQYLRKSIPFKSVLSNNEKYMDLECHQFYNHLS